MSKLTKAQREARIMGIVSRARNGMCGADFIAAKLGYRPYYSGRLAVSSTLRGLQSRGLVSRIPPRDQWGHAEYSITDAGRLALQESGE